MYSGGDAYFDQTLPRFGQEASYFAYQNEHWTLVGLDVAYHDHAIDDEQVEWLKEIVAQAGDRKVVLFSHHQLYSHFEKSGRKALESPGLRRAAAQQTHFRLVLGPRASLRAVRATGREIRTVARCIGHSGMPQSRDDTRNLPQATDKLYERADWRLSPAQTREGNKLPSAVVLEGRE